MYRLEVSAALRHIYIYIYIYIYTYMSLGFKRLTSRLGRFTPRNDSVPIIKRRSGQVRHTSPLPAFEPRTVQPVANRYID